MKNNKLKLISVIIPIYNEEKHIRQCIDSILKQTYTNIQIVCINDGSTDKTQEILTEYSKNHTNIKVISQKNTGLGGARNRGIKEADGEYIGFVDADDYIASTMYEELMQLVEKTNAEIAYCNVCFTKETKKHHWYKSYNGVIDANTLDRNIQPCNKLISKQLINRTNFQFYKQNGDDMLIILMLNAKKLASTDKQLYFYRVGEKTMSTSFKVENFVNFVNCTKEQIKEYHKTPYNGVLDEYFAYRMIYVSIQLMAVSAQMKDKKNFIKGKKYFKANQPYSNQYVKQFLRKEFSILEYYGMLYILPINYSISHILMRAVLNRWS